MAQSDIHLAMSWAVTQLTAINPAGGVHRTFAVPGTLPPFILITHVIAPDVIGAGGQRLLQNVTIDVTANGPALIENTLVTLANSIDSQLNNQVGSSGTATILSCVQQAAIMSDSIVNGEQWVDIGGRYLIRVTDL